MQRQIIFLIAVFFMIISIASPADQQRGGAINGTASKQDFLSDTNYYALIIGIDKYSGNIPPLATAVNDAHAILEVLVDQYGFSKSSVVELYNSQATKAAIIETLRNFAKKLRENDNLFIYYAGHGQLDDVTGAGHWVPADAIAGRFDTYLPNSTIRDYVKGIKAKHILLVSDSCFAGSMLVERTISNQIDDRYYLEASKRTSRKVITSGGLEPVSDSGKNGHSVFAYYLIEAFRKNESSYLVPSEIFTYIKTPLANNSEQSPIQGPLQGAGDEGGEFVFKNMSAASKTKMSFISDVESSIYVDGEYIGSTPLLDQPMKPGTKQWRMVCSALGQERSGTLDLLKGGNETVNVYFQGATSYLTVFTKPWTVVYVDGKKVGISPVANLKVTPGTHQVTLKSSEMGINKTFVLLFEEGKTVKIVKNILKDK